MLNSLAWGPEGQFVMEDLYHAGPSYILSTYTFGTKVGMKTVQYKHMHCTLWRAGGDGGGRGEGSRRYEVNVIHTRT